MSVLAMLGAGGHARVAGEAALASGRWADILWYDDVARRLPDGTPIGGTIAEFLDGAARGDVSEAIVGIGDGATRSACIERLIAAGVSLARVVHPGAHVSPSALIAPGVVVFAGAVVNAGASLDVGAIVNTAASIDHDCALGPCAHVGPGARLTGNVTVGERAWIGAGAVLVPGVVVGERAIVGAGAVVLENVPADTTVVGVPARIIGMRSPS